MFTLGAAVRRRSFGAQAPKVNAFQLGGVERWPANYKCGRILKNKRNDDVFVGFGDKYLLRRIKARH